MLRLKGYSMQLRKNMTDTKNLPQPLLKHESAREAALEAVSPPVFFKEGDPQNGPKTLKIKIII